MGTHVFEGEEMVDQYGKKMKEGDSSIEDSNGISQK